MEIDPTTGLPLEAIEWENLTRGSQRITVKTDKKRYGKLVTVISGFDKGVDVKKIAKSLKNELACGGTYKDDKIELQGDHMRKIKPILVRLGFDNNSVEE
ncbi:MAG: stress response translation initiation inhibitor YciH [Candidatus Diapherotrites archaeon]